VPDDVYWKHVRKKAKELNSDGCTLVTELYQDCCLEHDVHYRTGWKWTVAYTRDGEVFRGVRRITRAEADERFRLCIQSRSRFGRWSPIAAIRWVGVRALGWAVWRH
jgi:hypothetical protein